MAIEDVAHELYGLAPEDFTAARNARAKELKTSGDRELGAAVQALRRPTAGAWMLNQLARRHHAELEQVLELGIRLRAAQGTLGAAELRALDAQRRQLTRAVAGKAVAISRDGGRRVSAQLASEVEETLRSAMVDPDAGAALATGLLVDTFTSTGLDPVDLSRVVALGAAAAGRTGPPVASRTGAETARPTRSDDVAITSARRALEEADRALGSAREESEEARRSATQARRRREDLQSQLDEERRRLDDLGERVAAATEAESAARRTQLTAARGERSAIESAERARQGLEALLGGGGA